MKKLLILLGFVLVSSFAQAQFSEKQASDSKILLRADDEFGILSMSKNENGVYYGISGKGFYYNDIYFVFIGDKQEAKDFIKGLISFYDTSLDHESIVYTLKIDSSIRIKITKISYSKRLNLEVPYYASKYGKDDFICFDRATLLKIQNKLREE